MSLALLGNTDETHADLIHSDVPLWGVDSNRLWPRFFANADGWGCAHNVGLGDWRFDQGEQGISWFRFYNYGAFHCFLMVQEAEYRDELNAREASFSFLVSLGTGMTRDGERDLWLLQQGGRPGSDYLFLTSAPGISPITEFEVLQRDCPSRYLRRGSNLDILVTRYCAINSRSEMRRLARRMAHRAPLGRMIFNPRVEE